MQCSERQLPDCAQTQPCGFSICGCAHSRNPAPPATCRLQAERLAQRLQCICAEEGLRCEKSTLRLLVERTDCDIRSCLNTLQVGGGWVGWRGALVTMG